MIRCPVCDAELDADEEELDQDDVLICQECGASLTVTSVDPLEIEETDEDLDEFDEELEDYDEDDSWRIVAEF